MNATDPYFASSMPPRQSLVWASAVRRQIGRWEPLVAKHTLMAIEPNLVPPPATRTTMTCAEHCQGETERHLLLVAAWNMLQAAELLRAPPNLDGSVKDELRQARGLVEHWRENMPVLNVTPRPRQPRHSTGKAFASRNPRAGPYSWWSW